MLDDEIVFVYTDLIDKESSEQSINATLKKEGVDIPKEKYNMIIEKNMVRVKLNNLDEATKYLMTVSNVVNEDEHVAESAEISFSTADFSVKSKIPQINEDGTVSAIIDTAYNSEKTVYLGVAVYDENGALKNIEFSKKIISGGGETKVDFKPGFNIINCRVKVFILSDLESLTPVAIE